MNTKEFVNRHKIKIASEFVDANKNAPDWKEANHFKVTLRKGNKQLTTYFSQDYGISGKPEASSVLDCLASDAVGIANVQSFEDWASEYGYDVDSRKAERIYKVCEKQTSRLEAFLGSELYEALLYQTERL